MPLANIFHPPRRCRRDNLQHTSTYTGRGRQCRLCTSQAVQCRSCMVPHNRHKPSKGMAHLRRGTLRSTYCWSSKLI